MNSTSLFSLVGSPQPLVPPRQKEEEYKVSTLRKVFCFVFINDFCLIFFITRVLISLEGCAYCIMSIEVRRELVGVNLSSIKLGSKQVPYMLNLTVL